jgi:hypothetical protein
MIRFALGLVAALAIFPTSARAEDGGFCMQNPNARVCRNLCRETPSLPWCNASNQLSDDGGFCMQNPNARVCRNFCRETPSLPWCGSRHS